MSKEQSDKMDRLFKRKLGGTIAENWWTAEMSWEDVPCTPTPYSTEVQVSVRPPSTEPREAIRSVFTFPLSKSLKDEQDSDGSSSGYSSRYSSNSSLTN
jgi:hypothetical protein